MAAVRFILIIMISVGLTGCPTPVPTCREYSFKKPGIEIEQFQKSVESLPAGAALVFGQFFLHGSEEEGVVSVRLISYKDYEYYKRPYAEEKITLEANGNFQWVLPPGHYIIQPIYYHYNYEGVNYQSSKQFDVSLSFDVLEVGKVYHLGKVDLLLSSELDLRDLTISSELAAACSQLPAWVCSRKNQANVNLVRRDPNLESVNVARRKQCREWNIISWCLVTPWVADCFNVDR